MFKTKRKILSLVIGALFILVFSLSSTGIAEGATNVLQVQYKNIKIFFNGQQATLGTQPLIVNGSTYLPVRALANLFNMNINWDGVKQEITITEKANSEIESLKAQIVQKDLQIIALQAQVDANKSLDIDDLEDQLNDDYEEYEDAEWDISLRGDEDDVKVTIKIDLDDFDDEWDDLSDSDIEDLLQDICDDILDENDFEDADITGTIKDSSRSSNNVLVSFYTNSRGNVVVEDEESDLSDLEDDLNDEYTDLGDIDDFYIELDWDDDDITFSIFIDYDDFDDEWDELPNSEIIQFMEDIQDDIEDEFEDADVDGKILDTSDDDKKMAGYSKSNSFTRPYPQQ